MTTGKWIKTDSGRFQQIRDEDSKKVETTRKIHKHSTDRIVEASPDAPIAQPLLNDPSFFIKEMKKSYDRCEEMRKSGQFTKEDVGWAFYLTMQELFGKK